VRGRARVLAVLALLPALLAAVPPSLNQAFRHAAPPGWIVGAGREGLYEWLRFVESSDLDGEDYAAQAITLYRFELQDPMRAGAELTRAKAAEQTISRRSEVKRKIGGVRWKGLEAAYTSDSGVSRREVYLYATAGKKRLYLFWARGPESGWQKHAALREAVFKEISAVIHSGVKPSAKGEDGNR